MADAVAGDGRLTFTGSGIAPNTVITAGGNGIGMTAASSFNFAPVDQVTKCDIYSRDGAPGRAYTWAVDGGGTTVVTTTGLQIPLKTTVTLGSVGAHVINTAWSASNPSFLGMHAYNDAGGRREISLLNWGIPGAQSGRMTSDVESFSGMKALWDLVAPPFALISGFVNDPRGQVPIATSQQNFQNLINQQKQYGGCAYMTPPPDNSTSGLVSQQEDYVAAWRAVAIANKIPIIDVRAVFISFALANGLNWYSDTVHGTRLSHAVISKMIAEFFIRVRGMA
jgi:hypothetical protein